MSTAANTHQEYDYEEARKKKKLGALSTSFMIFKTTVGVGIYTFQYNYSKCGIVWGPILSVLVFSVIIYGCDQLLLVCCLIESDKNQGSSGTGKKEFNYQKQNELSTEANQRPDQDDSRSIDPRLGYFNRVELDAVQNEGDFSKHNETFGDFDTEEDQGQETEANVTQSTEAQGEYRIKTYHQISEAINPRYQNLLKLVTILTNMGMSLGFALGNYVFLIKALNELFHFTTATSSLIVYIGIFVILILIIEPEKIKPIAYLLSFFALSATFGCIGINYYNLFSSGIPKDLKTEKYNFDESGMLIGVSLFSFESIATLISVRRTSKKPRKMRLYALSTFSMIAIFSIIFAISFQILYGIGKYQKIAFDYYDKTSLIRKLKYLTGLNPCFSIPFNIITIVEIFEEVKFLSFCVKNRRGVLDYKRIVFTRAVLLTILFILTLVSTNIEVVFDLVGAIFGPILGIVLPYLYYELYFKISDRKISCLRWIFIKLMYCVGVSFIWFGIYASFINKE